MSFCGKKLSKQGLLTVSIVVLLSGCGLDMATDDGNLSAQAQVEPVVQLAGSAMKGVIQKGLVFANRLEADESGYFTPQDKAARPERTAEDGTYEWNIRGKAEGWVLVELEAARSTRMICDVVPHCDQPNAAPIAFGQPMELDTSFSLRGAGDLQMGTVNLTPLTHLAVALAESSPTGLSPTAIESAYSSVENWFGLAAGALRLAPPDLTRLDETTGITADALQAAIANAAFLALVNDNPQWGSISQVLANLTAQIRATGQISLMGDGTNLALADLISAAALQASALQATVDSSIISQQLVVVEYRNVQRFKTLADVYDGSETSVAESGGTATETTVDGTTDSNTDSATASTEEPVAETTTEITVDSTVDSTDQPVADTTQPDTATETTTETTTASTVPANAALLSWTAPLTRENGDSLAMGEIAGFEVVYGTGADSLGQSIAVGDASIDELLVDELTAGTWYFAIRTLDTDGNRSRLSNVVNKQI